MMNEFIKTVKEYEFYGVKGKKIQTICKADDRNSTIQKESLIVITKDIVRCIPVKII